MAEEVGRSLDLIDNGDFCSASAAASTMRFTIMAIYKESLVQNQIENQKGEGGGGRGRRETELIIMTITTNVVNPI